MLTPLTLDTDWRAAGRAGRSSRLPGWLRGWRQPPLRYCDARRALLYASAPSGLRPQLEVATYKNGVLTQNEFEFQVQTFSDRRPF